MASRALSIAVGVALAYTGGSGVLGGGSFALMGAGFGVGFGLSFGTPFEDWRLDEEAVVVEGRVTDLSPTNMTIMNEPMIEVHYTYELEGDRLDSVYVPDSHLLVDRGPGQRIGVQALAEEPEVSRIIGTTAAPTTIPFWFGVAFTALGTLVTLGSLALFVLGVGMTVWGFRRPEE